MVNNFTNSLFYKILYPLIIYFVLFNMLYSLGQLANDNYFNKAFGGLYITSFSAAVTLVVMTVIYVKSDAYVKRPLFEISLLYRDILYIIAIILLGVSINLIISHFPLTEISDGFKRADEYLNDGDIISKLLANVIITPALEEVVFRGIVCNQLEKKFDTAPTVIISAVIFGILHFNWVQMIYAFIVGLLIGFVYERTHKLWVVYLGHALLNLVVVLIVYYTA